MAYPDFEAKDKLVQDTLAAAGFTYDDHNGETQTDTDALKNAVYQRMVDKHVVDDPKSMAKRAVTKHELYASVLPDGPGVNSQPKTEEESLAREELRRMLWSYTNTGTTGYVNQRVEAEGLTVILCEAKVARTSRSEETGKTTPGTEAGRFLTDNPELIAAHSTLPRAAKLVKVAEGVAKHMGMTIRRHPELVETVARQIAGALNRSKAALNAPVNTKRLAASTVQADDDA